MLIFVGAFAIGLAWFGALTSDPSISAIAFWGSGAFTGLVVMRLASSRA